MNVPIETYRGFEIQFDKNSEKFTYSIDDSDWQSKQSYSACKKSIDDYLKNNSNFKPFVVRDKDSGNTIEIIGIRKDGRFIYEKDGKKEQVGEYSENSYILYNEKDSIIYSTIKELEKQVDELRTKIKNEKEKIQGETLRAVKKYLNPI